MSRDQCHEFTSACLSSISKRYDDKVNYLFANYDYDNDGYIDLDGFLNFYEKASQDNKTATVWSNLKSFGVNAYFRFPNETLFDFLNITELAPIAFHLLQRLPISKKIYDEVLGISRFTTKEELDLESIFKFENHYSYFYKLTIISYLRESEE